MKKIFCLAALLASTNLFAQELWSGAQYGMTEEQVALTSVDIKPSNGGNRLNNGAIAKLQKRGVEIAHENFTAQYYFLDGKLDQVMLSVDKGPAFRQVALAADQIKDALTSKYGAPISCENQANSLMKGFSCKWAKEGGNVSMTLLAIDETKPILNISYQTRLARDAAKL